MTMNENETFLQDLRAYESALRSLPGIDRANPPEWTFDEVSLLLFAREGLARVLMEDSTLAQTYGNMIAELDAKLVSLRAIVLALYGESMTRVRQRDSYPRDHWWWYLDDETALPQKVAAVSAVG
jgi:hypothetical protein